MTPLELSVQISRQLDYNESSNELSILENLPRLKVSNNNFATIFSPKRVNPYLVRGIPVHWAAIL